MRPLKSAAIRSNVSCTPDSEVTSQAYGFRSGVPRDGVVRDMCSVMCAMLAWDDGSVRSMHALEMG